MKIIMLIILFIFKINNANKNQRKCNLELIKSYKLKGLKQYKKLHLLMCPLINKSCCDISDQKLMFSYWYNGPEKYINYTFNEYNQIMVKIFNNMKIIDEFNNKMMENLKDKPMGNCKAMGSILVEYDFSEIENKYFEFLNKLRNSFLTSLKGLYCSLCDYDLQKYFNPQGMSITLNTQFCRSLIENSLIPLVYQKNYFPKLFNIITKMLMTCDVKGNYNKKISDKPMYIYFYENSIIIDIIESCIKNRNKSDWIFSCKQICLKFKIGSISSFFFMNTNKLNYFNNMISKLMSNKIMYERNLDVILDNKKDKKNLINKSKNLNIKNTKKKIETNADRKLYGILKPFEENLDNFKNKKKEIFSRSLNATLSLLDFSLINSDDGINLYSLGLTTIFSSSIYKQINRFLHDYKFNKTVIKIYKGKKIKNNKKGRN